MDCRYFFALGGDKISSWGRGNPVGAPKEKFPCALNINKEPTSGEISFVKRTVLRPCRRSRRASGLCGILLPHAPAIKRHVCQLLFSPVFFFLAKKKWERFPFPKVFVKLLSIEKINTETQSPFFVCFYKKINALTDSEKNLAYLQKMWYNIKYSVEQPRNLLKI